MIKASKNGSVIYADSVKSGKNCVCPVCGEQVRFARKIGKGSYFQHRCDAYRFQDTSAWSNNLLKEFDSNGYDVESNIGGSIADIIISNFGVILFHSRKSKLTFNDVLERTQTFTSLGYRVSWVFEINPSDFQEGVYDGMTNTWYYWKGMPNYVPILLQMEDVYVWTCGYRPYRDSFIGCGMIISFSCRMVRIRHDSIISAESIWTAGTLWFFNFKKGIEGITRASISSTRSSEILCKKDKEFINMKKCMECECCAECREVGSGFMSVCCY